MKKLFVILFALTALTFGQSVYFLDYGTLANSVSETQYLYLGENAVIDSIVVVATGTGELDVDSIDVYVGSYKRLTDGTFWQRYSTTNINLTCTINVDSAVSAYQRILSSDATQLTGAALRGVNALKVTTRGATSGNDATDPNKFVVIFYVYER